MNRRGLLFYFVSTISVNVAEALADNSKLLKEIHTFKSKDDADSFAIMSGDICRFPSGMYQIVVDAELVANGATVLALPRTGRHAVLLPNETLRDFAALLADTRTLRYVTTGDVVTIATGYRYRVANPDATNHHLTTAGGVKLYVALDQDGYCAVEAWGVTGDGSADDRVRMQAAVAATPYLRWQSREYLLGAMVDAPPGYKSHHKICLLAAGTDISWRTVGQTTLRITDALQAGAHANDIGILFQYDAGSFSAPGFIFDENAAGQGYGAPLGLYGVLDINLNGVTVRNCSPLRMGASATRLGGTVTGFVRGENGRGTFVVGSKPGGVKRYIGFGADLSNSRGGVVIEAEDVDRRLLNHKVDTAVIGQIVGRHIHDDINAVEFVKIENGAKRVSVAQIDLEDASSSVTGRATALSIKAGQGTPDPMDSVQVGQINVKDASQAIWLESESALPIGDLRVDAIHVERTRLILDCRNSYGHGAGVVRSVDIGTVQGVVVDPSMSTSGTAFAVSTNPASSAPNDRAPHLQQFKLGGGYLTSVGTRAFSVRGVNRFEVRNLTVDAHLSTSPSGGYAGTNYNLIEADEIILDGVTLRGFAGSNTPLVLCPKISCRLIGLDLTAGAGATTALLLGGSGTVLIDSCTFRGATNALNFTASTGTFNAATAVNTSTDQIKISSHVFRHGEKVRYTAGTTPIGGLTTGMDYYVLWVDANTIQLSTSLRGTPINITSAGVGEASFKRVLNVLARNNINECSVFEVNSANLMRYLAR